MILSTKKALDSLFFWVGDLNGEIYVGIPNKHGGIEERVVVTARVEEAAKQRAEWKEEQGK